jgi:hypothetical protein
MARRDKGDDCERVELTPRQQRDMQKLIDTFRSEKSTDEQRDDASGMLVGYLNSAMNRCKS